MLLSLIDAARLAPPAKSAPLLPPSGTDGDIRPAFALDGSGSRIGGEIRGGDNFLMRHPRTASFCWRDPRTHSVIYPRSVSVGRERYGSSDLIRGSNKGRVCGRNRPLDQSAKFPHQIQNRQTKSTVDYVSRRRSQYWPRSGPIRIQFLIGMLKFRTVGVRVLAKMERY